MRKLSETGIGRFLGLKSEGNSLAAKRSDRPVATSTLFFEPLSSRGPQAEAAGTSSRRRVSLPVDSVHAEPVASKGEYSDLKIGSERRLHNAAHALRNRVQYPAWEPAFNDPAILRGFLSAASEFEGITKEECIVAINEYRQKEGHPLLEATGLGPKISTEAKWGHTPSSVDSIGGGAERLVPELGLREDKSAVDKSEMTPPKVSDTNPFKDVLKRRYAYQPITRRPLDSSQLPIVKEALNIRIPRSSGENNSQGQKIEVIANLCVSNLMNKAGVAEVEATQQILRALQTGQASTRVNGKLLADSDQSMLLLALRHKAPEKKIFIKEENESPKIKAFSEDINISEAELGEIKAQVERSKNINKAAAALDKFSRKSSGNKSKVDEHKKNGTFPEEIKLEMHALNKPAKKEELESNAPSKEISSKMQAFIEKENLRAVFTTYDLRQAPAFASSSAERKERELKKQQVAKTNAAVGRLQGFAVEDSARAQKAIEEGRLPEKVLGDLLGKEDVREVIDLYKAFNGREKLGEKDSTVQSHQKLAPTYDSFNEVDKRVAKHFRSAAEGVKEARMGVKTQADADAQYLALGMVRPAGDLLMLNEHQQAELTNALGGQGQALGRLSERALRDAKAQEPARPGLLARSQRIANRKPNPLTGARQTAFEALVDADIKTLTKRLNIEPSHAVKVLRRAEAHGQLGIDKLRPEDRTFFKAVLNSRAAEPQNAPTEAPMPESPT